ncbi:aminoacyl-tRNA deacylase [Leuconostocaceae bacterium ESL0723]|nr:aminoacyl-tRNA deacylase [Leuconostocaceae bacterium ESL0723]
MAKKKSKKTLPEQVLDQHGIAYTPWSLNVMDQSASERAATLAPLGLKDTDIYKTLAANGDKTGPLVAVLPITEHLSLKKLAAVSGNKKAHMLPLKDLQKTTGYIHGANNPVGIWQNKKFPIYLDQSAEDREYFLVSAGELNHSDQVNPKDIAHLVDGHFADLTE